jgi:serine/threonine-protein kinase
VELGSGDWRTHAELGLFLYRRARYDDAIAAFEQARQVTPDNVIVLRNLGPVYYLAGRFDEAASALQRALEIRPAPPVYANLGTVRFFQGRYSDAVIAFEKAVEGAANNYLYWGNLADAYRWAPGRRDDAPAAYQRARELLASDLAKRPDDAELRTRHALYLAKGGDTRAAASEVTTLSERTDLTPQMLFRIVVVKELTGDRTGALDALRRALAAGYPVAEIAQEPELVGLRADARYHRLVVDQGRAGRR